MLTAEELASFPVLAQVREEPSRLAGTAADIHLEAGDYLVHEGDPRALFVVIAGRIELNKSVAGTERVIGARLPGTVYGEVPMIFGTQMQATACATEPSRVLRIDPRAFHALAATSKAFTEAVGALALERLGGLQGIAAEPPKPQMVVVGQRWGNRILFEGVSGRPGSGTAPGGSRKAAGSSSSSAPMPRPTGCPTPWRATRAGSG